MSAYADVQRTCEEIRTLVNVLPHSSRMRQAIETATYSIETITRSELTPPLRDVWPGTKPQHARILTRLITSLDYEGGHWVSCDQLFDALYWDKDKQAEPKIVHVLVTQCRRYLEKSGLPFWIEGNSGRRIGGWRMRRKS